VALAIREYLNVVVENRHKNNNLHTINSCKPFFFLWKVAKQRLSSESETCQDHWKIGNTISKTMFKVTNNLQFVLLYQLLAKKTTQVSDFVNNHAPRTVDMNSQ